jgi:hypothetical protein
VCFRMFVCDSELRLGYRTSSSEKEFLSAPIHSPPLWFAVSVLQVVSELGAGFVVTLISLES